MKRGFFVGMILTVTRIFRCNPFCAGGYDPVPLKGFRNKKDAANENFQNDGGDEFMFDYDLSYDTPKEKSKNKNQNERTNFENEQENS